MRLRPSEVQTIKRMIDAAYGPTARVILFGSRVDDSARGGDIDLLVEIDQHETDSLIPELRLKSRLSDALRGRKVDLIVHPCNRPPPPIVRIAQAEGVIL